LQDVVLSLADTTGGSSANVSIYSDDGLNEPGSLLATLSSGAALTTAFAPVTWTSSSLPLSANSTYWVVLSALRSEVDWSYAADDGGSGAGFTDTWAASYDSGGSWYVYASLQNAGVDPLQMSVETAGAAAPEPGTAALCLLIGGLTLAAGKWTNSRKVGR
jgi:hypothetical protein